MIFGSAALVQSLLPANVVDEYRFIVHPVMMGGGKRVFKDGMPTAKLELIETKKLPSGVIVLNYRPAGGTSR